MIAVKYFIGEKNPLNKGHHHLKPTRDILAPPFIIGNSQIGHGGHNGLSSIQTLGSFWFRSSSHDSHLGSAGASHYRVIERCYADGEVNHSSREYPRNELIS